MQIFEYCQCQENITLNLFKQQLRTIYLLAEMFIIRQAAKHDLGREEDVQLSCTKSSVSSPKNHKHLIQEANSKHFTYYALTDWLFIL